MVGARNRSACDRPASLSEAIARPDPPTDAFPTAPPEPPRAVIDVPGVDVPRPVSQAWLDRAVPVLSHEQLQQVVAQLRQRGWTDDELATRVLVLREDSPVHPTPAAPAIPEAPAAKSLPDVIEEVLPGVVSVLARLRRDRWSTGSGFAVGGPGVLAPHGVFLTNAHVTAGAAEALVRFPDDRVESVIVLAESADLDIAVLAMDDPVPTTLATRELARVRVGEPAIAIGSPLGQTDTVTLGIVSALKRTMRAPSGAVIENVIRTDAAINPGNSGGPLIDDQGRAMGVNTMILVHPRSDAPTGLGFAVPIETALAYLDHVEARARRGRRRR